MPTSFCPIHADNDQSRMIQEKCVHRRPPAGRQARNDSPRIIPCEVFVPRVGPRIENRDFLTRSWVAKHDSSALAPVAVATGQPEIGFIIRAAAAARHNRIDLQNIGMQMLWTKTVSAAILRIGAHFCLHFG